MAKKIEKQFKIMAPGGTATPAPPLGPALGAAGVNPGQFIQQFNDRTRELNGKVVGCIITVYADRSFDFEIKSSPAAVLIREAAGIEKGSGEPATNKVGTITEEQVRAIHSRKTGALFRASLVLGAEAGPSGGAAGVTSGLVPAKKGFSDENTKSPELAVTSKPNSEKHTPETSPT